MKKKLNVNLALIILFSLFSFHSLFSYCPSSTTCTNWENGSEYIQDFGCFWRVDYSYLECGLPPNTTSEIEITGIDLSNCTGLNDREVIMKRSIRQILWKSHSMFAFAGTYDVILQTPSCFYLDLYVDYFDACLPVTCCSSIYTLTVTDNNIQATDIISSSQSATCTQSPPVGYCEYMCDALDIDTETDLYQLDPAVCGGDCEQEWVILPGTFVTVSDYLDCDFDVYYAYRICGSQFEFYIYKIDFSGNDCDPASDWCSRTSPYTAKGLYERAIERILKVEGDNYIGTISDYVHRSEACWQEVDPTEKIWLPCNFGNCCSATFTLQNSINGIGINSAVYSYGNSNCSYSCLSTCSANCRGGNIDHIPDVLQRISGENETPQQLLMNDFITYVQPNPTSGSADIILQCEQKGRVKIKVYNSIGNEILSNTFEKQARELKWTIQTGQFSSGAYYYNIYIDGSFAVKGNFIVDK